MSRLRNGCIAIIIVLTPVAVYTLLRQPSIFRTSAENLADLQVRLPKYSGGYGDPRDGSSEEFLGALHKLPDEKLERLFNSFGGNMGLGFEFCLTEMIRRGGAHWENVLQARLNAVSTQATDIGGIRGRDRGSLLLLTALQRIKRAGDPLRVLVDREPRIEAKMGYVPPIKVSVINDDPDRQSIFNNAYDDEWRIVVADAAGHTLPEQEHDSFGFRSRPMLYLDSSLGFGQSTSLNLSLEYYVSIDKPGTYTIVVISHPEVHGALRDPNGLICYQSQPIALIVNPIEIQSTAAEQASAAALILELPREGAIKVLDSDYGEEDYEFLPKASAAGQLKRMGWAAVPKLIEAVSEDNVNPTQRAWALGLLSSITDHNDPLKLPQILGSYEYRFSTIDYERHPHRPIIKGFGRIDVPVQLKFALKWKSWIDDGRIQVKIADPTKHDAASNSAR